MALKSIGIVGVPKTDEKKRYIRLDKGVTLRVTLEDGTEITLPGGSYLNMFAPKQGKNESDEKFAERCKWQRFSILVGVDD